MQTSLSITKIQYDTMWSAACQENTHTIISQNLALEDESHGIYNDYLDKITGFPIIINID